jgi:hypothetical protein
LAQLVDKFAHSRFFAHNFSPAAVFIMVNAFLSRPQILHLELLGYHA